MKLGYSPDQIMELYTEICQIGMSDDINWFTGHKLVDLQDILRENNIEQYHYENLLEQLKELNMTQCINIYEDFLEVKNK